MSMAALPKYILKGVKYEFSDIIRKKQKKFDLPENFDIKDPEVLLEECEYDFSIEKKLLSMCQDKGSEEKHYSLSNKDLPEQIKPTPKQRRHVEKQEPFQQQSPEKRVKKRAPAVPVKQKEDFREMKDALENVVAKEQPYKAAERKSKPRSSAYSSTTVQNQLEPGVDKYDQHGQSVGVPVNKTKLLDQLTDLLTDDVKYTENA